MRNKTVTAETFAQWIDNAMRSTAIIRVRQQFESRPGLLAAFDGGQRLRALVLRHVATAEGPQAAKWLTAWLNLRCRHAAVTENGLFARVVTPTVTVNHDLLVVG